MGGLWKPHRARSQVHPNISTILRMESDFKLDAHTDYAKAGRGEKCCCCWTRNARVELWKQIQEAFPPKSGRPQASICRCRCAPRTWPGRSFKVSAAPSWGPTDACTVGPGVGGPGSASGPPTLRASKELELGGGTKAKAAASGLWGISSLAPASPPARRPSGPS